MLVCRVRGEKGEGMEVGIIVRGEEREFDSEKEARKGVKIKGRYRRIRVIGEDKKCRSEREEEKGVDRGKGVKKKKKSAEVKKEMKNEKNKR